MQEGRLKNSPDLESILAEFPEDREYDSKEHNELDEALVEAIRKAEAADNEYLATLLKFELGSHYYSNR